MTTSATKISSAKWNTYAITSYTHDVAQDQASAGGVHMHQVRRTRSGNWQKRICQSNGRRQSYGSVEPINASEGEALFARAEKY